MVGKTKKQSEEEKKKGETKKKPQMKDILAKKSGGKKSKKKWSKTKSKEKLQNSVFWTKANVDKLTKDVVAKEVYLSPSVVSDKLKVNVSLARAALQQLVQDGHIVPYQDETHSKFGLFVKSEKYLKDMAANAKPVEEKKGGKKEQQQKK